MVETTERTYSFGKIGRGLSSLITEPKNDSKAEPVTNTQANPAFEPENLGLRLVSVELIKPSQYQPRTEFNKEALQELSASIAKSGIIQPIVVRSRSRNEFEIIAGERRWRAAKMAGLQQVPIVIRQLSDREVIEVAIVENVQRRDLNPLEEAYGYRRLLGEFGYTQDDLSRVMGKSRSHIANLLRLLSLPEKVKNLLVEEKLSMSHARALIGYEEAEELAKKIVEFGLSVRETEIMVQQGVDNMPDSQSPAKAKKATKKASKSADVIALEEMLMRNLNAKVEIAAKGKKGEIRIKYKNLEELDNILAKIG
jgi:ParB family chromosome partitioning protein